MEVGSTRITLYIESGPDGMDTGRPVVVDVTAPPADQNRWAGDAAFSYAQTLGRTLWSDYFSGALGLAVSHAAKSAEAAGQVLSLRLVPGPDATVTMMWQPWELLVDPADGGFKALAAGWSIVRGMISTAPARPLPAGRPLRILVVSMLYLDEAPEQWRAAFSNAAGEMSWLSGLPPGRCAVTPVIDPDRAELLELVQGTDADVVHVIGTGVDGGLAVRNPDSPDPFPYGGALSRRDIGLPAHRISGSEMAEALAKNMGIGLVVLNGCDLGGMAEDLNFASRATVLAHRGTVADPHAAKLTEFFYPSVLDGAPLDVAISEARRRLELEFPGQAPWASTVLFTGWPPAAFVPPEGPDDEAIPAPEVVAPGDAGPPAPESSAADLVALMHRTDLERLARLSHQAWSPVAAQVAMAKAGEP
jgi:hypothetical protein